MFQKTTLKNGLRVLTSSNPGFLSTGIWVFVKTGSRYESSQNCGISHFLEHMLLKGSRKYPSQKDLAIAVEGSGGEFNGMTRKEVTSFFVKVPKEKIGNGIEIILDMVLHPKLLKKDFENEKGVIIQEINRRNDNPEGSIFRLLDGIMWPKHPLGQPVAGYKDTVNRLKIEDLKKYFNEQYTPQNMIVVVCGDINHQETLKIVEKFFDKEVKKEKNLNFPPLRDKQKIPKLAIDFKKTSQSHLMFGIRTFNNNHPDKYILNVINSLLGLGWSSRLMLNIRTKRGLTYTIHSGVAYLSDTGFFYVNSGVKNEELNLAIKEIINELRRLKKELVEGEELNQAKEKLKGRFLFGIELPEDQAEWYGMQEIFQPKILSPKEVLNKIDKVTNKDIMRVSEKLFTADRLNLALIGPFKEKDKKTFYELLKKID